MPVCARLGVLLMAAGMTAARMSLRGRARFHGPGAIFLLPGPAGRAACLLGGVARGCRGLPGAPVGVDDLPGVADGDGGGTGAGGDPAACGGREPRPALGTPFAVAGRPVREQAGEDPAAGALGGGGQGGGGGAGGREGLGQRADGLAAGDGERHPVGHGGCRWRTGTGGELARGGGQHGAAAVDAQQLGCGHPGPHLLNDLVRGGRAQDRAGGWPGAGDRGLVLADRGFRCVPPVRVAGRQLSGGVGAPVHQRGGQRVQLVLAVVAAGDLDVVLDHAQRDAAGAVGQEGPVGAVRQRL